MGTEIVLKKPADGAWPTVFSNHVQIVSVGEDVYLDFCLLDPPLPPQQPARDGPPVSVPAVGAIPAVPAVRVIVSAAHAGRLATILLKATNQRVPNPGDRADTERQGNSS